MSFTVQITGSNGELYGTVTDIPQYGAEWILRVARVLRKPPDFFSVQPYEDHCMCGADNLPLAHSRTTPGCNRAAGGRYEQT